MLLPLQDVWIIPNKKPKAMPWVMSFLAFSSKIIKPKTGMIYLSRTFGEW